MQITRFLLFNLSLLFLSTNAIPADEGKSSTNTTDSTETTDPNLKLVKCLETCDKGDVSCRASCTSSANPDKAEIKGIKDCINACITNKEFIDDSTKSTKCINQCYQVKPEAKVDKSKGASDSKDGKDEDKKGTDTAKGDKKNGSSNASTSTFPLSATIVGLFSLYNLYC